MTGAQGNIGAATVRGEARPFVARGSVVRRIWGDPEVVFLVFAGAAAEFALNKAVDWLFFTGKLPNDPVGRLFSTVRYAREIVFADEETAARTLRGINAAHAGVEGLRGQTIPEWAFRDVLYMLVDYSERAHRMLYGTLSRSEREELYEVFRRVGLGLNIKELPEDYESWRADRESHMASNMAYSRHTALLYDAYRRHLGALRYRLLLEVQALLVPERVRGLLKLKKSAIISAAVDVYAALPVPGLRPLLRRLLLHPRYWNDVAELERTPV